MIGQTSGYIFYRPASETLFNKSLTTSNNTYTQTTIPLYRKVYNELFVSPYNSYTIGSTVNGKGRSSGTYIGSGYPTFTPFNSGGNGKATESNGRPFTLVDPGGDPIGPPISVGDNIGILLIFAIVYVSIKKCIRGRVVEAPHS